MKTLTITELQEHCHHVGLEEFLCQLSQVFERAEKDTKDFDYALISNNYGKARQSVDLLLLELFGKMA